MGPINLALHHLSSLTSKAMTGAPRAVLAGENRTSSRLTVAVTTLGCKVNRSDADDLVRRIRLHALGAEVPFEQVADVYVINTCMVTGVAERQSRQTVFRARRRNPRARIILTGCMAAAGEGARALLLTGQVDRVFSLKRHDDLLAYLESLQPQLPQNGPLSGESLSTAPQEWPSWRARPYLKVQDGCSGSCTYCVVPALRGPARSLPLHQVRQELQRLACQGFAEVVLAGIHLGQYGWDLDPPGTLAGLLHGLEGTVPRLRLSSVEPQEVDAHLMELVCGSSGGVCPHLHLPLQSGDDATLAAMNRPYSKKQVADLLCELRARRSDLALGADLMTGFPGENEARFGSTLHLLERSPLTHLHVFVFSARPQTKAGRLPGQVPGPVARARAAQLRRLGEQRLSAFAQSQVGQVREVLVETRLQREGMLAGITDNYLRVRMPGSVDLVGRLVRVHLEGHLGGQVLRGRAV